MRFGRAFFGLQLRFAERVAAVAGMNVERALLDYTNLYVRFAIGRAFDAAHPVWRDYLAGLVTADDAEDWTYRFFLGRPHEAGPPGIAARFGCFAYAAPRDGTARLHFENVEPAIVSPLGSDRRAARLAELRTLVAHAAWSGTGVERIAGVSWLYNLPAYRRLFPETYLATASVAGGRFRNMPLWGQFLDRDGGVREAPAALFRERLDRQRGLDGLADCFPLQPLAVSAPLADFCAFHRI